MRNKIRHRYHPGIGALFLLAMAGLTVSAPVWGIGLAAAWWGCTRLGRILLALAGAVFLIRTLHCRAANWSTAEEYTDTLPLSNTITDTHE
jgi:hypothetical protein